VTAADEPPLVSCSAAVAAVVPLSLVPWKCRRALKLKSTSLYETFGAVIVRFLFAFSNDAILSDFSLPVGELLVLLSGEEAVDRTDPPGEPPLASVNCLILSKLTNS